MTDCADEKYLKTAPAFSSSKNKLFKRNDKWFPFDEWLYKHSTIKILFSYSHN